MMIGTATELVYFSDDAVHRVQKADDALFFMGLLYDLGKVSGDEYAAKLIEAIDATKPD